VDRKAFRVCINDDNRRRFLDPAVWPDSISISEWFFKGQNVNEKRRRVHDSSVDPSRTVESANSRNQASASLSSSLADSRAAAAAAATATADVAATGSTSSQAHDNDEMSGDDTNLADPSLLQ